VLSASLLLLLKIVIVRYLANEFSLSEQFCLKAQHANPIDAEARAQDRF